MSKKFRLNRQGVKELMQSADMQKVLEEYAGRVANNTGMPDAFEIDTHLGKTRRNVGIKAATKKAKKAILKNNILLKALR